MSLAGARGVSSRALNPKAAIFQHSPASPQHFNDVRARKAREEATNEAWCDERRVLPRHTIRRALRQAKTLAVEAAAGPSSPWLAAAFPDPSVPKEEAPAGLAGHPLILILSRLARCSARDVCAAACVSRAWAAAASDSGVWAHTVLSFSDLRLDDARTTRLLRRCGGRLVSLKLVGCPGLGLGGLVAALAPQSRLHCLDATRWECPAYRSAPEGATQLVLTGWCALPGRALGSTCERLKNEVEWEGAPGTSPFGLNSAPATPEFLARLCLAIETSVVTGEGPPAGWERAPPAPLIAVQSVHLGMLL